MVILNPKIVLLGWFAGVTAAACGGSDSQANDAGGAGAQGHGGASSTSSSDATGGKTMSTTNPSTQSLGGSSSGLSSVISTGGTTFTSTATQPTFVGGTTSVGSTKTSGGSPNMGGTKATGGSNSGGSNSGGSKATGGSNSGGKTNSGGTQSTGGTTSGTSTNSCITPPAAGELLGWAAVSGNGTTTTTGGGNATPVTVTTLSELQSAAKGTTASVIYVKGVLSAGAITVGSNKTIVGLCGAEIHGHLELNGSVNVIIRNVKIVGYAVGNCASDPAYNKSEGCSSGADAVTVQNSAHHIWFDHCDISDGTDGNLDITKGSDYVTVSWTKFHYTARTDNEGNDSTGASGHRYSNLIGGDDSENSKDKLNITWHHNWWGANVHERQPQVRFGKNHLFNNLWTSSGNNYCVRAVIDAHILLENNVFSGVKDPHLFYGSASSTSNITADSAKNTYTNTTGSKVTGGTGAKFTPSYDYTMDTLSQVQSLVTNGAGPK
jgi:pectate lyase